MSSQYPSVRLSTADRNTDYSIFRYLSTLFLLFLICSITGWLYETALEFIQSMGYTNRGIFPGPWCPIYGVGGMIILSLCTCINRFRLRDTIWQLLLAFTISITSSTLLELLSSYLLESYTGSWPWTYADYPFNFEGRIALSTSIRFGLSGMILDAVYPKIRKYFGSQSPENFYSTVYLLGLLSLISVLVPVLKLVV